MALHRGIQSALFFYLSCAPCADYRHRKKRRRDAARDRAEREALEAQMPNLYRHPSPSSTNPFWQAEIELGPNPPQRGKKRAPNGDIPRRLKSSGTQRSSISHDGLSLDMYRSESQDSRHDSKLRVGGHPYHDDPRFLAPHPSASAARRHRETDGADTIAVPQRLRTKSSATSDTSRVYRNPAINDLHPAIATRVASKEDVSWMLQPPPPAEVMVGKQRSTRTRSDSGSSRLSVTSSRPMSRQVSNPIHEPPVPEDDAERSPSPSPAPAGQLIAGQDHDRIPRSKSSRSARAEYKVSQWPLPQHPSPLVDRSNQHQSPRTPTMPAIPRPAMTTMKSDGYTRERERTSKNPRLPRDDSRTAAAVSTDSPSSSQSPDAVLRALAPKSRLHSHMATRDRSDVPENWQQPDFEVGPWVLEHTKREVRERWSMDI